MQRKIFPSFPEDKVINPPEIPPITIKESDDKLIINNESSGNLDDDIFFREISKTIQTWFDKNYVMNMKTYGASSTRTKDGSVSDLSCLYYSILKAISPDVQNGSNPFRNTNEHYIERGKLIHNLKRSMIDYLFTDLNYLNNPNISQEIKTEKMYSLLSNFVTDPNSLQHPSASRLCPSRPTTLWASCRSPTRSMAGASC